MASKHSAAIKLTALLLVIAIAQVYVLANPGVSLFGRLITNGDSVITINSAEARSGTTVLPGAQLQTPEDAAATVRLESLGKLDIAPNTNLTLDFSEGKIDVNVVAGEATLTANKGVNGSITFNGKVERTDPSVDSSTASATAAAPAMSKKKKAWWWIGGIGGGIFLIWLIWHLNHNPSPHRP